MFPEHEMEQMAHVPPLPRCLRCNGKGELPTKPYPKSCPVCKGTGERSPGPLPAPHPTGARESGPLKQHQKRPGP